MRRYRSILLVEDNDSRAKKIRAWFRHERVNIVQARSGEKALGCLEDRYDLILLDHDLGEGHPLAKCIVDGRRVVAKLVASTVNRGTPIIIHSMNLAARNEMAGMLRSNGFLFEIRPFNEWDQSYAAEILEDLLTEL
ncbi:MAG: response regulator [Acidobacteria bacterium]|nr:response regulator [Acidobacteriota bacterium]